MAQELWHRWHTWYFERRLGVATSGFILEKDFDYVHADNKPYAPIGYEHLRWALNRIPFSAGEVEFVDIGAGKGRAVVTAATRAYRKVTGVEISPTLAGEAKRNLGVMRHRRAQAVEVVQTDATLYSLSATANVFYLFNPFDGETLQRMVEAIRESFAAHPRRGFVIFFNHKHFEKAVAGQPWIRKVYDGEFYPQYSCGLYEIG